MKKKTQIKSTRHQALKFKDEQNLFSACGDKQWNRKLKKLTN